MSVPGSSDFAFGTGDFCVECWYYNDTNGGGTAYNQIVGNIVSTTSGYWRLGTVFAGGNDFWFTHTTGGFNDVKTGVNVNDGKWHHLAATRSSGTFRLFVDGIQRASATITTNFNQTSTLYLMYSAQQPGYASGYLQDVRIYKGVAKYTSNFDPVISYVNSFHLDFADNSTAAALGTDTSGNGNDWTVNNLTAAGVDYSAGLSAP